jgi:ADP-ribose pyrophosphatase YjhB (NUDIX family)
VARTLAAVTSEWTATLPRKRMGAALLFRDPDDRVLLVEPTHKPYWELPGGVVEATSYLEDGRAPPSANPVDGS